MLKQLRIKNGLFIFKLFRCKGFFFFIHLLINSSYCSMTLIGLPYFHFDYRKKIECHDNYDLQEYILYNMKKEEKFLEGKMPILYFYNIMSSTFSSCCRFSFWLDKFSDWIFHQLRTISNFQFSKLRQYQCYQYQFL